MLPRRTPPLPPRERRDRADADVLVVEELQPLGERPCLEHGAELGGERVLSIWIELGCRELRPLDQLAQPREELRLERPHRQMPIVGRPVDPVAGKAAGEEARERITAQPVRDEAVRAMRHRDRQPRAAAGACPLEECSEDLGDRAERAGGEVGRLERRQVRRGVFEHARPAEVVQVVTRPRRVRALGPETRDRAVDRGLRNVVRADAEPLRHARPEAFEDTSARASRARANGRSVFRSIATDSLPAFSASSQARETPTHRVAVRLLEPDDAGAEPQQLAGRKRARQVAGQVDDEHPCERLHRCRK